MLDAIASIPYLGTLLTYVLPFLLVLSVVVAVHEYGHYVVARWRGVHSEVFSVGFGPELFGWNDKRGTRWRIAAIPLGGYVRFRGDADEASSTVDEAALTELTPEERARSFPAASLWSRTLIVAAGPIFNFVLAAFIFSAMAFGRGLPGDAPVVGSAPQTSQAWEAGLRPGDRLISYDGRPLESFSQFMNALDSVDSTPKPLVLIRDGAEMEIPFAYVRTPRVTGVSPGSPAAEAGLRKGDVILALNGEPVASFDELSLRTGALGAAPIQVEVARGDGRLTFTITPEIREIRLPSGELQTRSLIGLRNDEFFGASAGFERMGLAESAVHGVKETGMILSLTLQHLGDLVRGRGDLDTISGPVGIAEVSGQAARMGLDTVIRLMAIVSASIGLLNLFPIPILDGGRLVFYAIEGILGRPLSIRAQEIGAGVGVALMLMLMAFATFNDLTRIFS
ncbi:RIP metalloprotease RseP [Neomegalonema perideroedes]|uniref:RIP metalloprotease RseP n=1 Tax=Neomegalonema perideroedes TaxID=217219 RepID=UPI000369505E|nr:RIP metalloprotease RseP [Neomegalonema perideroedes]